MIHHTSRCLLIVFLSILGYCLYAQTPVAANGKLKLAGYQLCNENGFPVQLRGLSSHGLQWYGGCINATSTATLQQQWNADVVRLAMYVDEGGYLTDTAGYRKTVVQMVNWAVSAGLYVIVDWHILTPGNPLNHTADAKKFFQSISLTFKSTPNVIYEICNEPNGGTANEWSEWIRPYAIEVIPVIRANNPDAIILVGTPRWSSKVGDVYGNPLPADLAKNCLYSFHFYGGTHFTQSYINEYSNKLPIFATEWGTSNYTGNYGNNYVNSQDWLDMFAGKNIGTQLISWCNWSFSDKSETSAALATCGGTYTSRTESGDFVWKNLHDPGRNFITAAPTKPVIVVQPFPTTVTKGTPAELRVKALGSGVLAYQWYFKGVAITSATDTALTIEQTQPADTGLYHVMVTNTYGQTSSRSVRVSFDNQTPANGSPQVIPGVVEFEKYDAGGEGISYHDANTISTGAGADTSMALVDICDNEWVEYTINVTKTGFYKIEYLLKTEEYFPKLYWAIDGIRLSNLFYVPNTSYAWKSVTDPDTVHLTQGLHIFRLIFDNGGSIYLDNAKFSSLNIDCHGDENGTATIDSCGICSGGSTGITPPVDTDGDGTYDCNDLCPNDPEKTAPGVCGCGVVDGTCPDCAGMLGGTATIDQCKVCSGGNTGIVPNSSCKDCAGVINGTASIDLCKECSGGTTGFVVNASCTDCAGVLNGTASLDQCGVCTGGTTGKVANASCTDCRGIPNGTAVVDACGVCDGDGKSCVGTLTPYKGVAHVIPGRIEAEDFDAGGAEVAYHESTYSPTNEGGDYRTDEGVDIDLLKDGTGYALGWFANGEWVKYSVSVKYTGNYLLKVRNGTPTSGLKFSLLIDGKTWSGDITAINTGSYDLFDTTEVAHLPLTAGSHVLTLNIMGDGFNIDWFDVSAEFSVDCNGTAGGSAQLDSCSRCVGGTTGLTACASQTLTLQKGWNLVSFNVTPTDKSPAIVFSKVLPLLETVKDNVAFYSPLQAPVFNSLTSLEDGRAYFVKMASGASLTISGTAMEEVLPTLASGWNLVGCPYKTATLFKTVFSGQTIILIKNFEGFWIPSGTSNSISGFVPGKGYLLRK